MDSKRNWVRKLREVIQETYFNTALRLNPPRSPSKSESGSHRSSRDLEELGSNDDCFDINDRASEASYGSGNSGQDGASGDRVSKINLPLYCTVEPHIKRCR